jgi:hypothetical protein
MPPGEHALDLVEHPVPIRPESPSRSDGLDISLE